MQGEHNPDGRGQLKKPHDFLAAARALIANRPANRDTPAWMIAGQDQEKAAADESGLAMQERHGEFGLRYRQVEFGPRAVAMELAILAAMTRRIPTDRTCPHVLTRKPGERIIVSLSIDRAACPECTERDMPAWVEAGFADEDHCDICEEPTKGFHPFITAIGGLVVNGNVCPTCLTFTNQP